MNQFYFVKNPKKRNVYHLSSFSRFLVKSQHPETGAQKYIWPQICGFRFHWADTSQNPDANKASLSLSVSDDKICPNCLSARAEL